MKTHTPAILISALIHLGLLALVLTGVSQLPADAVRETRLAVNLQMFQAPPAPAPEFEPEPEPDPEPAPVVEVEPEAKPVEVRPSPPPKPEPVPKPKPKPSPTPKPPNEVKPVEAETPPSLPAEQTTVAPLPLAADVDSGMIQRLEDEYRASLRQAIEANKGYPASARRLRQEGAVVVGFTVRRDGIVEALRIVESSGSRLLDQAARTAVEKISGRLPFPGKLRRSQWDFTIPINYSLR